MPLGGFPPRLLIRDIGAFLLLAALSLGSGLLINFLRTPPLPLSYISKEKRLELAVRFVSPSSQATPAQAPSSTVRTVELDEFQKLIARDETTVLDARSATFYRLGHVPGALNLSRDAFERDYAALRPTLEARKNRAVAVYCSGADCQDSELVATALAKLGFENVLVYAEGWEQWTEAGLPQEPPAKNDP